mmetsp:Transcript_10186/g.28051  ORF Transcript_10186/g.28051 Transcript_10186/m.28051 type:complete len:99 (+) Transcript_10186:1896-2192(+)
MSYEATMLLSAPFNSPSNWPFVVASESTTPTLIDSSKTLLPTPAPTPLIFAAYTKSYSSRFSLSVFNSTFEFETSEILTLKGVALNFYSRLLASISRV